MNKVITIVKNILLRDISKFAPIFVKKNNKLCGMLVLEQKVGWGVIFNGDNNKPTETWLTRKECIVELEKRGYEFYVDI